MACGAAIHQKQRGQLNLDGHNSEKLPTVAIKYSITELKLC